MQLLIDSIYEFYNDAENLTAFEEWRKNKYENKNTTTKESSQINGLGVRRHSKPTGISL